MASRLCSRSPSLDHFSAGVRRCMAGEIRRLRRAWVLPRPEQDAPGVAPVVRTENVQRIAAKVGRAALTAN